MNILLQKAIDFFKRPEPQPMQKRDLVSAISSRLVDFKNAKSITINAEILQGLLESVRKARFLALNSPFARSWLALCQKNTIGKAGITLQCQVKKNDTDLDSSLNDKIEWEWWQFGKHANNYLTVDGNMRSQ